MSWHWYPNVNNLLNTYNFHQQTYLVPLWKKNEYIAKENLSLVAYVQSRWYKIGHGFKENKPMTYSISPYVQSSCDTPSGRDEYVSELMKHIKVDSYGHCLHNTDLPSSLRNPTVNNFSIFLKIKHKILKFFNANIFQRFVRELFTPFWYLRFWLFLATKLPKFYVIVYLLFYWARQDRQNVNLK